MEETTERPPDELTATDRELVELAATARHRSHAPFSGFAMGAALRTTGGDLVPGAVIENVAFPSAMCAERVALTAAVAHGVGRGVALALVSPRTRGELTWPCGACLQVAVELAGPELRVLVADPDLTWAEATVAELAPRLPNSAHRPD